MHQVIEFTPEPCFKPFGNAVLDARRAGDADPSKVIIADTMKLVSFCFILSFIKGWEQYTFSRIEKTCLCLSLRWAIQAMVRRLQTN